ncbi:protein phosphatase 2C Ptc3 [Amanita muscaria]
MGQFLSSPETEKKTGSGGNDRYLYAVTEMQGWRFGMEDAHAAVLDLDGEPDSNGFFAVYDGHGGGRVSNYAGENLHKRLLSEDEYHERNYDTALKKAFLGTDEDLFATGEGETSGGATAVAALLTSDNKIYVANAGDSRSVIDIKGEAKPLSFDHKPTNEPERARICAAGGYIESERVNGNLALSRALGDFQFKKNNELTPEKQIVTADPDVICHEVTEEDEFLVLLIICKVFKMEQGSKYLRTVDGQDASIVAEDVDIFKIASTVLELGLEEVTNVGRAGENHGGVQ